MFFDNFLILSAFIGDGDSSVLKNKILPYVPDFLIEK